MPARRRSRRPRSRTCACARRATSRRTRPACRRRTRRRCRDRRPSAAGCGGSPPRRSRGPALNGVSAAAQMPLRCCAGVGLGVRCGNISSAHLLVWRHLAGFWRLVIPVRNAEERRMATPVFRFAPSPNGYLHLGHALSALLNFDMARAAGGRLLLRIEDIDETRCRPEYEQAIFDDLAWLGIAWEQPVRRQSEHLDDYRAALARLEAQGLLYPSFESRAEIAALVAERERARRLAARSRRRAALSGQREVDVARRTPAADRGRRTLRAAARYGGGDRARRRARVDGNGAGAGRRDRHRAARRRPPGATSCWRARKRRPAITSSVVVDDALQGVTHVVRGQDLFCATSVHRLLQTLLGLPAPAYHHHRLLLDADGRKLSKSTQATGLRELRAQGVTPADIRRMVGLSLSRGVAIWPPVRGNGRRHDESHRRPNGRAAPKPGRKRAPRLSTRAIETTLAELAHEIRTPLTGILALGELLATAGLAAARARMGDGDQEHRRASRHAHLADRRCGARRRQGPGAAPRPDPAARVRAVARGVARCARPEQEHRLRDRDRAGSSGGRDRRRDAAARARSKISSTTR